MSYIPVQAFVHQDDAIKLIELAQANQPGIKTLQHAVTALLSMVANA